MNERGKQKEKKNKRLLSSASGRGNRSKSVMMDGERGSRGRGYCSGTEWEEREHSRESVGQLSAARHCIASQA